MSFAPELVGAFQDSEAGPGRHAPVPRSGLPMSRSVGEPLADYAAQRPVRALLIVNAETDSVAVAEIEFGEIAMKVLLADVLIDAINSALQDREIILGSIGRGISANVFLLRVIDGPVTCKPLASFPINAALVSSQVRSNIDLGFQDRSQIGSGHLGNVVRANAPFA